MAKFQSYIQPTIIKVNDTVLVKGLYYICWNIPSWAGFSGTDIPRIYFSTSLDDNDIYAFCNKVKENINHIKDGAGIFTIGEDYWPSESVISALSEPSLPYMENYLLSDGSINPIYGKLDYDYYNDIKYYDKQNDLINTSFEKEELDNFYSTFASYILDGTTITPSTLLDNNNQIYSRVLNYLKEFKHDETYVSLVYILNNTYSSTNTEKVKCGCTNSKVSTTTTQTCPEIYTSAMTEYIKSMFGDVDFLYDWLYNELPEGRMPNDALLDLLMEFIQALIDSGYQLVFNSNKKSYYCKCPNVDSSTHDANIAILNNYIQVLQWAKDCKIDENKNKIKTYGQAFGELLPNLQF